MNPYGTMLSLLDASGYRTLDGEESIDRPRMHESITRRVANCLTRTDLVRYCKFLEPNPLSPFVMVSEKGAASIIPHDQLSIEPIRSETLGRDINCGDETLPEGVVLTCDLNEMLIRLLQFSGCFTALPNDAVPVTLEQTGLSVFFGHDTQHITLRAFAAYSDIEGKAARSLDHKFAYWVKPPKSTDKGRVKKSELHFFDGIHKVLAATPVSTEDISNSLKTDLPPDPSLTYNLIHSQEIIASCEIMPSVLTGIFPRKKPRQEKGRCVEISPDGIKLSGSVEDKFQTIILSAKSPPRLEYSFITYPQTTLVGKLLIDMVARFGHAINLARTKIKMEFYSNTGGFYWMVLTCHFGTSNSYGEVCIAITTNPEIVGTGEPGPIKSATVETDGMVKQIPPTMMPKEMTRQEVQLETSTETSTSSGTPPLESHVPSVTVGENRSREVEQAIDMSFEGDEEDVLVVGFKDL